MGAKVDCIVQEAQQALADDQCVVIGACTGILILENQPENQPTSQAYSLLERAAQKVS